MNNILLIKEMVPLKLVPLFKNIFIKPEKNKNLYYHRILSN